MSRLPNFIIAGASKSGTTSLWHYLKTHPDIYFNPQKEIHFFNKDENYLKGINHYQSYFVKAKKEQTIGEATPAYFRANLIKGKDQYYHFLPEEDSIIRIAKEIPNVKLILSLRNPIYRMYSQYVKKRRVLKEDIPSFIEAIKEELEGKRNYKNSNKHIIHYLYDNTYPIHLKKWFDYFPKKNIKILIFEECGDSQDIGHVERLKESILQP